MRSIPDLSGMNLDDSFDPEDVRFMSIALALARRGVGRVWPNPSVGCAIVKNGRILGRGTTDIPDHAEVQALNRCGSLAEGATVYVTLEPCVHYGKTPPCTQALIQARVARVVIACQDPDPRVRGKGVEQLREAGVSVVLGVLESQARTLNQGFFFRVLYGRPLVTLKLATSVDGSVSFHPKSAERLTNPACTHWSHGLRLRHDAILVGRNTVEIDDPRLTCRLPGVVSPRLVRVVLDTHARTRLESRVVATAAEIPTWIAVSDKADPDKCDRLRQKGVDILRIANRDRQGRLCLETTLSELSSRGVTRLLVEGGPSVTASFLRAKRADYVLWIHAPLLLGGTQSLTDLDTPLRLEPLSARAIESDEIRSYAYLDI